MKSNRLLGRGEISKFKKYTINHISFKMYVIIIANFDLYFRYAITLWYYDSNAKQRTKGSAESEDS